MSAVIEIVFIISDTHITSVNNLMSIYHASTNCQNPSFNKSCSDYIAQ